MERTSLKQTKEETAEKKKCTYIIYSEIENTEEARLESDKTTL